MSSAEPGSGLSLSLDMGHRFVDEHALLIAGIDPRSTRCSGGFDLIRIGAMALDQI